MSDIPILRWSTYRAVTTSATIGAMKQFANASRRRTSAQGRATCASVGTRSSGFPSSGSTISIRPPTEAAGPDIAGGFNRARFILRDEPYRPGDRAMLKVKQHRTADCVVGGFRRTKGENGIASLLPGLYDDTGLLHHVGFTSAIAAAERRALLRKLEPLVAPPGFTGKAPAQCRMKQLVHEVRPAELSTLSHPHDARRTNMCD
ncbi:hypothetical protein ABIC65_003513 [Sphingomonas trueperi]|uniref:hypothetical protein n=1 Tax=Sphingomonas trueperi TaxID=53317 RepID=UPI0033977F2B